MTNSDSWTALIGSSLGDAFAARGTLATGQRHYVYVSIGVQTGPT